MVAHGVVGAAGEDFLTAGYWKSGWREKLIEKNDKMKN